MNGRKIYVDGEPATALINREWGGSDHRPRCPNTCYPDDHWICRRTNIVLKKKSSKNFFEYRSFLKDELW